MIGWICRTLEFGGALALLTALMAGCTPGSKLEVKNSGLQIAGGPHPIAWLDNTHIIANIHEKDLWIAPDGTEQGVDSIIVWNVETGEIKQHAGPGAGWLCVGEGFVRYFQRRLDQGKYDEADQYFGPFGQEKKTELTGPIDPATCRPVSEPPNPPWLDPEQVKKLRMLPLRPEHGWLEIGGGTGGQHDPSYPVAIHPVGAVDRPIPLDIKVFQPWTDQQYSIRLRRYEAFKAAYLLTLDDNFGKGGENGGGWWLYPDGRIEPILIYGRKGRWVGVRSFYLVPANSVLMAFSIEVHPKDLSGLYLMNGKGELESVTYGWPGVLVSALSPDGCKLAFGIDPQGFQGNTLRLHFVDVCGQNSR